MAGYCPTVALDSLLRYDVRADDKNTKGETALHRVTKQNTPSKITLLLKNGADVNAKSTEIDPLPLIATARGAGKASRILIDHGADLEAVGRNDKRLVDY